jgi:hypothetical protein
MSNPVNYTTIPVPYNYYMQREGTQEIATSILPDNSDPNQFKPVISGDYLDNLYLNTWIKSTSYKPKAQ